MLQQQHHLKHAAHNNQGKLQNRVSPSVPAIVTISQVNQSVIQQQQQMVSQQKWVRITHLFPNSYLDRE